MILHSTRKPDLAIGVLREAYASGHHEPDLGELIQRFGVRDIDGACDLVEADVRERIERRLPVLLSRYLNGFSGVLQSDEFIDTVIDLAIQARVASGATPDAAADAVQRERPDLQRHVDEARALSQALSMSSLVTSQRSDARRIREEPPAELGSPQSDGRPRYEILNSLGRGAFGQVFRAIDRALTNEGVRAEVAIKILDAGDGASLVEASRARRVRHASVVRVFDHGFLSDGRPFIVYELVEGRTLRERVEADGPLPPHEAVELMISVIEGVHSAHGVQVLHRDLNPGNILLDRSGAPRVTDFGAAAGMDSAPQEPMRSRPLGAPGFIAPEQWRGEGTESVQTDVFGLGALLFYAITGKCPNGSTIEEAREFLEDSATRTRMNSEVQTMPRDLGLILLRALGPNPSDRHPSAAQLADDLRSWIGSYPIAWTRPGMVRRVALAIRRRPMASVVATVGAVVVFASLAFGAHFLGRVTQQRRDGAAWQSSMRQAIGNMRSEEQISGMLCVTIAMEFLAPESIIRAFLDPATNSELRLETLRSLATLSDSNLGPQDPRTRVWRAAAAMSLLTEQNKRAGTLEFVQSVRDDWADELPPDSVWMRELDAWIDCARTKEIFHRCWKIAPPSSADAQTLREIAQRLESSLPLFDGWLADSPTPNLVFRALGHIYGPHLLNIPDEADRIAALKEAAKPPKAERPKGILQLL